MTTTLGRELPAPLTPEQFASEFGDMVGSTESGDSVGLATMQFAAQTDDRNSLVRQLVDVMCEAHDRGVDVRLIADERYVRRMTRLGNRDYPNYLPLWTSAERAQRRLTRVRTNGLLRYVMDNGIFVPTAPQRPGRGYTPWLRHIGSFHIGQGQFSVVHSKAAYVARQNGDATAWINTGNFTDSDLCRSSEHGFGMNNLTMRVQDRAAAFVVTA